MRIMSIKHFCFIGLTFFPVLSNALKVEIQGKELAPPFEAASCVDIAGDYPSVRIEASEMGKIPRICYNSMKINSITILNSVFMAAPPVQKNITLHFEHSFPPGINGNVMARAKLQGFFSTAEGTGVATGNHISFSALFSQAGHDDAIMPAFEMKVGDSTDSASFDFSAKKNYLISGPRSLKVRLDFVFNAPGQRLNLLEKNIVVIDTGSTFEDKLDNLEEALPADLNQRLNEPFP